MHRVVFRRSLIVLLPLGAVLTAVVLLMPTRADWVFVVVYVTCYGLLTWRQRLVCSPDGVQVTVLQTRRIPWAHIYGFRAGSLWRGGTEVLTTAGSVWSPAPGSWWGGPAKAADLAALEQARPHP